MDRIEKLKQFLAAEPHDSFTKHALAMEYISLGDEAAARRLLEEVLERDADAIGSYYQLGKLLERAGEDGPALQWYERGMEAARRVGEKRAYNELRAAYEELAAS
ncbi:MAG TPA: tetratricopeptide repeat protein [Puia sp.]|jgi:FimV-like protein|nr:tetratricopeptide repeat protein [Puia sp.]